MGYDYFYGKQPEQYQFYKLPKMLIKDDCFKGVSMDAKVLYSMMLDRAALSAENGWLDEAGRVYIIYTVREICKDVRCGLQKAVKLLKELEQDCGLIRRKKINLCKPDLIYVMNFASDLWKYPENGDIVLKIKTPGFSESKHRDDENQNTGVLKNETLEFRKSKPNKTDNNKTENSDTDLISSDSIRSDEKIRVHSDGLLEKEMYRNYFIDQLDVPSLLERYPYDEERIREIIELLTDICSGEDEFLFVGKTKRSGEVVRSRLMGLEYGHICYVLHAMDENHADVRNIRQYLLTALYNAPVTMKNYYQAKVNHDMAYGAMMEEGDNSG